MVVSNRLYPLLTSEMRVKLDGVQYEVQLSLDVRRQYEHDYELYFEASEFNYFCYNKKNRITCWPTKNGEQPVNDQGQWKKEGRQEMKPGKFINQFIDKLQVKREGEDYWMNESELDEGVYSKIQARTCEVFADTIKGANTPIDFEISEIISDVYGMNPHSASGHLRSSCMRPDSSYCCRHHAGFYDTIPGLKIAHKVVAGESLFRALLWTGVKVEGKRIKGGITFLDRIYGSDAINLQMIEYAKAQGWAWRGFESDRVRMGEESKYLDLHLPVPEKSYQYLASQGGPYMDTLYYLSHVNGVWRLSNNSERYKFSIQECDGDPLEVNQECRRCGDHYPESEMTEIDGDQYCPSCVESYCKTCANCGEDHFEDNMFFCHDDNSYYCNGCYEDSETELQRCRSCGEIHFEQNMQEHRGNWYCKSCYRYLELCPVCGKLTDPHDFHINRVVDGQVFRKVCSDCMIATVRCQRCNDRIFGELPLRQGWMDRNIPHYCDRCIQESKEHANDPEIVCGNDCGRCPAHGKTCGNPYADQIEPKPENPLVEIPEALWRQFQNPMVFMNVDQYGTPIPVIEMPEGEDDCDALIDPSPNYIRADRITELDVAAMRRMMENPIIYSPNPIRR